MNDFRKEIEELFNNFIVIPKTYTRDDNGKRVFDYEYMEQIFNEQLQEKEV